MLVVCSDGKKRCFAGVEGKEFYTDYHDTEWGVPVHDDQHLFEMLLLEGCQAGLSWEIILKRREAYRAAFHRFDPEKVAQMSDEELLNLYINGAIIRNKRKIFAARQNAIVFLKIQKEFGSFDRYLLTNITTPPSPSKYRNLKELPCQSKESQELSKDLKKRGMTFVGPKIIYSFMQAVGLINDHLIDCWCYPKSLN